MIILNAHTSIKKILPKGGTAGDIGRVFRKGATKPNSEEDIGGKNYMGVWGEGKRAVPYSPGRAGGDRGKKKKLQEFPKPHSPPHRSRRRELLRENKKGKAERQYNKREKRLFSAGGKKTKIGL